jgi:dipeptidyl aminopeptidase/acylaminoacyl peptidase
MSARDPIVTLLADLERPVVPRREFAQVLLDRLIAELRLSPPGRDPKGWLRSRLLPNVPRRVRIALVLIGLFLVFAGIATATYLATRTSSGAPPTPRNGRLTIIGGEGISEVDRGGRLRTVWRCRRPTNCGILTSVAWAPNGRQLAFTMAQFNRPASGRGLHILDTRTGETDVVPTDRLGCRDPRDLAWSPDGSRLAYACPSAVVLIHADGSDRRVLARRGGGYSSPSWSPDGTRVVFAVRRGSQRVGSSSIYVVNIYGLHERLLAARATAPAWSPDGKRTHSEPAVAASS